MSPFGDAGTPPRHEGAFDGATPLSPDERRRYEEACHREVRTQLERITTSAPEPFELRSVELEGRHPDTRLRVMVFDTRNGRERTDTYALWRSPRTGQPEFLGYNKARESLRVWGC